MPTMCELCEEAESKFFVNGYHVCRDCVDQADRMPEKRDDDEYYEGV